MTLMLRMSIVLCLYTTPLSLLSFVEFLPELDLNLLKTVLVMLFSPENLRTRGFIESMQAAMKYVLGSTMVQVNSKTAAYVASVTKSLLNSWTVLTVLMMIPLYIVNYREETN